MFLKIRALRKTFVAPWDVAGEGLLLGVDPQVVEEVAALPELLQAVLALHDSSDPFCFGMKIFEDLEILCIGNVS